MPKPTCRERSASTHQPDGNDDRQATRRSSSTPLKQAERSSSKHRPSRTRSQAPVSHQDRVSGRCPADVWDLQIGEPRAGLFGHPLDKGAEDLFQCVFQNDQLVGLLAEPAGELRGLVVTSPGAGGGPGPADPEGGGGGGTYGGYNVYRQLAAILPSQGITVLLMHYADGEPGGTRQTRVPRTAYQMETLTYWYQAHVHWASIPTILIGWSMGGAVVIEAGARMVHGKRANIYGVATIASQTAGILQTSLELIVNTGAKLLVMAGSADTCLNPRCSDKIGRMAGVAPEIFPGEDHGVESACGRLAQWIPELFQVQAHANAVCISPSSRSRQELGRDSSQIGRSSSRHKLPRPGGRSSSRCKSPRPGENTNSLHNLSSPDLGAPVLPANASAKKTGGKHSRRTSPSSGLRLHQVSKTPAVLTASAKWDPTNKSPDIRIEDNGLVIQGPTQSRHAWHAAFVQTNVDLSNRGNRCRFDVLVEQTGDSLVEWGVATKNQAKKAALHWPGLQNTSAWTYASTGIRFANVPGADEFTWSQPFGDPYSAGDIISVEVDHGELCFRRNGQMQGTVLKSLPSGKLFVGATLGVGARLRLVSDGF